MHGLLREGWVSDALGLALFTDSEIFGWTKQRRSAPARRVVSERAAAARESFIADLQPGDLVVHVDHGIARYGGLVRTPVGATPGQETSRSSCPATPSSCCCTTPRATTCTSRCRRPTGSAATSARAMPTRR